jgi:two-component system sensor histidine kinase TctE
MPILIAVAHEALLREALGNLVFNAISYTPAHGTITVHASVCAEGWTISVEDDGPGLTPEERATLGHRFQQGRRAAKGGSGLGLAIARSIAERHGGELALRSRVSTPGLQAVIRWPRCTAQVKTKEAT